MVDDNTHNSNDPRAPAQPAVLRVLTDNHDRFLAFVERRVGSRDDAQEILQDAFVRSLDRGGALRDGDSAVAWMYRVLRNALTDHYRRRAANQRALDGVAAQPVAPDAPLDDALMSQVCACVTRLMATVKPEYAEALRTVDLDGESLHALAAAAQITVNNAAVRLHRAREALRQQLVLSCGTGRARACSDCDCADSVGEGP